MAPDLRRLAMVAGEASGDLLGSLLLGGLQQRWPALQAHGIGGPRLVAGGLQAWWPAERLAVNGLVEVLRHYREIVGIRRRLGDRLLRDRPDLFIGVDAPDFNLDLALRLKRHGVRTVQFVGPSIWAWRGGRVHKVARAVDAVLCLFPFEPALYERHGVRARFVGHPLADTIPLTVPRAAARHALRLPAEATVVALLPGSRRSELLRIGPGMLAAAADLQRRRPSLRFVLPCAPGLQDMVTALRAPHPELRLQQLDGAVGATTSPPVSHRALAACDVAIVASGTASLEAALFKRPMVITYTVQAFTWQLMRRMSYLPYVGLPNILLQGTVVPELLQHNATPSALADATLGWLDAPARAEALVERFTALHLCLRRNTPLAATDAIEEILSA